MSKRRPSLGLSRGERSQHPAYVLGSEELIGERNLKLVLGFLRDYLSLHRELIERVDQELAGAPERGTAAPGPD